MNPLNFKTIQLVSWDVDGTLYSLEHMKLQLLYLFLYEVLRGRTMRAAKELAALRRYRLKMDAARLSGGDLNEDRITGCGEDLSKFAQHWYGHAIQRTGPRNGLTDLLNFLTAKNIPQVILSDYDALYKLEALRLKDRFAAIYVGERLGFLKPSPKGFARAAADFGVSTNNILHIGDRADLDGAAAHVAGCQCLIFGLDFENFGSLVQRFISNM